MGGGSGTRDWDAGTYDRVSAPQLQWAGDVLGRLELTGVESVLDAGCGSGRVSELVAAAVPQGRLLAVDGSLSMAELARDRLGALEAPARIEVVHSDLLELELTDGHRVDAVFSNATFHWIGDHPRLFERIHSWLVPGGRLEAQCGGEGNVAAFLAVVGRIGSHEPYAQHLSLMPEVYNFASPRKTEQRLREAGFERVRCWLQPLPTRPPEPRSYAEAVCLGAHLEHLPPELRSGFVDAVVEAWGPDHLLDYVRLNISAQRP